MAKISRNEPCPCGSGKKYKKCCIKKINQLPTSATKNEQAWTLQVVHNMYTNEILSKLQSFGIPMNRDLFQLDALKHNSMLGMVTKWQETYNVTLQKPDSDFIWYAGIVLWERITPNYLHSEQLDASIIQGYRSLENSNYCEACDHWLSVWNSIEEYITRDMKTVEDLQKVFSFMLHDFENVLPDLEMHLGNAGRDDKKYHNLRIKFCEAFCKYFPEEDELTLVNIKRGIGDAHFSLGNSEQGEATFKALVEAHPMNAWGYIGWGDVYAYATGVETDLKRAKEIYKMALGRDMEDEADVVDRIENLRNNGYR